MDGETTRVTITAISGAAGVIIAAFIASRTTIISAEIALKQLELKEHLEQLRHIEEDDAQEEEIARLRARIKELEQKKIWRKK